MDISLTTGVLKEALGLYPKPEIFNTDQGSQYTAKAHIDILKKHNVKISMNGKVELLIIFVLRGSGEASNMKKFISMNTQASKSFKKPL